MAASNGTTTLRDVLHLAEERAVIMRALDMDRDRDDETYIDLQEESDELRYKIEKAIDNLPLEQRQQLIALYDPLSAFSY